MNKIEPIEKAILGHKAQLTNHRLYHLLSDLDDVRIFMEKHVYAVWDFMSLLKALQNHLTCTSIPWKPAKNAQTARFINEIVLGEETDVNELQVPISHFEMYLDAMKEVQADTEPILNLVEALDSLDNIEEKLDAFPLKPAEKAFLTFTFKTIQSKEVHKIASAFTFGREDLIPDIFIEIIKQANGGTQNQYPKLKYYLERHIEVDGDEHGPLSLAMIRELCGEDEQKWAEALQIAKAALEHRILLWDEMADAIATKKPVLQMDT